MIKIWIALFIVIVTTAFFPFHITTESAMLEGMTIEATNAGGTIKITAGKGTWRTYCWSRGEERVELWRRWQRWFGSKGLYHPSGAKLRLHLVIEEGQQHFCSEQEALEWLIYYYFDPTKQLSWAYSSDGLVVGWRETGGRLTGASDFYAVSVDVWQIYINGQKPTNLLGAVNDRIRVSSDDELKVASPKIGAFVPSKPKVINQRVYSGRAVDLMKERGITADRVEKVIKNGELIDSRGGMRAFMYKTGGSIVVLDNDGRVITLK
jgi:hypothetical protein